MSPLWFIPLVGYIKQASHRLPVLPYVLQVEFHAVPTEELLRPVADSRHSFLAYSKTCAIAMLLSLEYEKLGIEARLLRRSVTTAGTKREWGNHPLVYKDTVFPVR